MELGSNLGPLRGGLSECFISCVRDLERIQREKAIGGSKKAFEITDDFLYFHFIFFINFVLLVYVLTFFHDFEASLHKWKLSP